MKNLIFFFLLLLKHDFIVSQCYSFDIDFGDNAVIPYCQEKLVTITITNTSCGDEYFDVYVTSDDNTLPSVLDIGDFTIVPGPGLKVAADHVFIPANGTIDLHFTFNVLSIGTNFSLSFLSKTAQESLYTPQGLEPFYIGNHVLLTGLLSDLLADPANGLFPPSNPCNPNHARNYVVQGDFYADVDYCLTGIVDGQGNPIFNILTAAGSSIHVINSANLTIKI